MMMVRTACLVFLLTVLAVPSALAAPTDDSFIAGYAAAVLERELSLTAPSLRVHNGVITLAASDLAAADRARAGTQPEPIRGWTRVVVLEPGVQPPAPAASAAPEPPRVLAEWQTGVFPGGVLFKPLVADPRWPHFAAAWQRYLNDRQFSDIAAVSFGESFAFYRDRIAGAWWEVGLQAGVFSVFDIDAESFDLVNADYLVGIELRSPWPSRDSRWRPIAAVDVQHREENGWSADVSARAGIEIDGVLLTRKLQILLEYFTGHSPNGQFYKDKVQYFGLGTHFHF